MTSFLSRGLVLPNAPWTFSPGPLALHSLMVCAPTDSTNDVLGWCECVWAQLQLQRTSLTLVSNWSSWVFVLTSSRREFPAGRLPTR